jgi:PAS domain S-box-containing protein
MAWGTHWRSVFRVVAAYAVIASLWILLSDRLLYLIQPDPQLAMRWAIYKGWGFVVVTATILGFMLLAEGRALAHSHEEVRLAEERLRLLGDNLPDTYVFQSVEDAGGRNTLTYLSAGVERVHGVRPSDALKMVRPILSQVDPYHAERLQALQAECGKAMKEYALDVRFRRPDHDWRWLHLRARPRRLETGQLMWDGVASDITERLKAEESLRSTRELAQLAVEGADIGIWHHDVATGAVQLDERARAHFGLTDADTTIDTFLGCIDPQDAARARAELAAQLTPDSQGRFATEFRVRHADGTVRWLALGIRVWHESIAGARRAVRGFGTTQDITERRAAEEALRRSEAELRAMFDNASIGIVQVDARDGRLLRFNDTYTRLTGYRADELLGMRFADYTHPDDRAKDLALFDQARVAGTPGYTNEKRYVRKDGSVVWVRVNATFLRDASGEAVRTVTTCEDITARHLAQSQLASQHDELLRWRDATLGREGRVLELKREVNEALALAGRAPRYSSTADPERSGTAGGR